MRSRKPVHPVLSVRQRASTPSRALLNLYHEGVDHHQAGRLAAAERCYRAVLASEPRHADSLHLLGLIGYQTGHPQVAEGMMRKAIALNSGVADYHCNLGSVLEAQGRHQEAVTSFELALHLDAAHTKAENNLGNALLALGRAEEAIAHYTHVLALRPREADVHNNLGSAFETAGRRAEAKACYEQALVLVPGHAQASFNLARLYHEQGDLLHAEPWYRHSLSVRPDYPEAYNNLGNLLREQGKIEAALASYRRAIALNPKSASIQNNLANLLRDAGQFEEALHCYTTALRLQQDFLPAALGCAETLQQVGRRRASVRMLEQMVQALPQNVEVRRALAEALRQCGALARAAEQARLALTMAPRDAESYFVLGNTLYDAALLDDAVGCYEEVLALQPEHARAHLNLAITLLKRGEYERGWQQYEWRWKVKNGEAHRRDFSQPLWRGEALDGRRILLHCEQGLGDSVQFLRFLPQVRARGGRIVLELPRGLVRMAGEIEGLEACVVHGNPLPCFDVQLPLMSLPLVLGLRSEAIPAAVPYLPIPASAREQAMRRNWPAGDRRIGLVWAGNPTQSNDRWRSMPFTALAPLCNQTGMRFYSLQVGAAAQQCDRARVADLTAEIGDMADTAALIEQLDLVITVDTSVAHLAGALGRPVWVLLAHNADWRWGVEGEHCPWYPTARLFRQSALGDWRTVVDAVASALRSL